MSEPATDHEVLAAVLAVRAGTLSTLLWQATMRRLGEPVSARQYVTTAARVGLPALAVAAGGIALLSLVW